MLHISPERRIEYFRQVTDRKPSYPPSNPQPNPKSGLSLLDRAWNDPEVHQDILEILDERCGCLPDPLKTHSLQNYLVHWSLADLGDEEKVELAKLPDLLRTLLNLSPERRIEYFRKVNERLPSHPPSNLHPDLTTFKAGKTILSNNRKNVILLFFNRFWKIIPF